jgi:hypothetical protein
MTAVDVIGGADGTYSGDQSGVCGFVRGNCAVSFLDETDTPTGYVTLPSTVFLPGTGDFSVLFWFMAPDEDHDDGTPISFFNLSPLGFLEFNTLNGPLQMRAVYGSNTTGLSGSIDTASLAYGEWHLVVLTYEDAGNNFRIYSDGALDDTATGTAGASFFAWDDNYIGFESGAAPDVTFHLDDVAFFVGVRLTDSDVADLWDARTSYPAFAALVASLGADHHYDLDEFGCSGCGGGWYVGVIGMS